MIESYDKLTLGKWLELKDVDTNQEDIDIQLQYISILSDMSVDELSLIPLTEYTKLVEKSMFLTKEPVAPSKLPKTIKINDRDFRIEQDVTKLTTGQYIDYQTYLKAQDLAHILTCFIIPKGKKYGDGYELEEVCQFLKDNLPIGIALCISRFFFALWLRLTNVTLDSSIKKMRKAAKEMKNKQLMKKLDQLLVS